MSTGPSQGVERFVTGQYSKDHEKGVMLGYVLNKPVSNTVTTISDNIVRKYGSRATLTNGHSHPLVDEIKKHILDQTDSSNQIELSHLFIELTEAAS